MVESEKLRHQFVFLASFLSILDCEVSRGAYPPIFSLSLRLEELSVFYPREALRSTEK
jgi:hypothetical protein